MTARRNLRTLTGPASSPLVFALGLGLLAVAVGLIVRPRLTGGFGGFGNDASTIQWIMSSPFDAADLGYGSYRVIADFYTRIGVVDAPFTAGVLGAVIGAAVLGVVVVRVGGVHRSWTALALALFTPLAIGVYEAAYAKEVLISLGMLVIVLMPVNWLGELLVLATLVVLGAEFRTYWLIVAGLYVVIRLVLARRPAGPTARTPWHVIGIVTGIAVLTGLAVWIGAGVPADSFRIDANDTAARQANTGSLITRFVDAPEPVGGVLNSTLTSLAFILPLPMLAKLSPYYLVIGMIFAFIWISTVRSASIAGKGAPLLSRCVALPLAFLVVQGLFEPDWGSALRHATPLLPFIVGAAALADRHWSPPDPSGRPPSQDRSPTPLTPQRQRTTMTSRTTTNADGPAGGTASSVITGYLGHLRRWWWFLVIGLVLGGLAGWGASALMTTKYTATSQVYVGTAGADSSSDAYNGAMLSQKQVGSYVEMAKSPALADRVIGDLGIDRSTGEVAAMLSPAARKDTVIIELHASSGNADLSRDVANSAAAQLRAMVRDLNEETSPDGRSGAPQLAILNKAVSPTSPSSPDTRQNIVLGALLGLVLGILAALVRGLTDRRITDTGKIRDIIDAPVVGSISSTPVLAERHTLDFTAAPVAATEQFRELRTNLRFLDVDNPPTVVAVTSGTAEEGKSTVAVNLALTLAEDGENVCLVDADLRDPSVVDYLGGNLQSAVGLSTVLAGDVSTGDVVQRTATDGLSVVTSGAIPPNPAELLGSRRFGEILGELGRTFDHVILDASPSLPVTDGALVAAAADGVLLTVRYNSTTADRLVAVNDNLTAVNSRLLGTVFTLVPEAGGRYGAKGYGAGYGYGHGTSGTAGAQSAPVTTGTVDSQNDPS